MVLMREKPRVEGNIRSFSFQMAYLNREKEKG